MIQLLFSAGTDLLNPSAETYDFTFTEENTEPESYNAENEISKIILDVEKLTGFLPRSYKTDTCLANELDTNYECPLDIIECGCGEGEVLTPSGKCEITVYADKVTTTDSFTKSASGLTVRGRNIDLGYGKYCGGHGCYPRKAVSQLNFSGYNVTQFKVNMRAHLDYGFHLWYSVNGGGWTYLSGLAHTGGGAGWASSNRTITVPRINASDSVRFTFSSGAWWQDWVNSGSITLEAIYTNTVCPDDYGEYGNATQCSKFNSDNVIGYGNRKCAKIGEKFYSSPYLCNNDNKCGYGKCEDDTLSTTTDNIIPYERHPIEALSRSGDACTPTACTSDVEYDDGIASKIDSFSCENGEAVVTHEYNNAEKITTVTESTYAATQVANPWIYTGSRVYKGGDSGYTGPCGYGIKTSGAWQTYASGSKWRDTQRGGEWACTETYYKRLTNPPLECPNGGTLSGSTCTITTTTEVCDDGFVENTNGTCDKWDNVDRDRCPDGYASGAVDGNMNECQKIVDTSSNCSAGYAYNANTNQCEETRTANKVTTTVYANKVSSTESTGKVTGCSSGTLSSNGFCYDGGHGATSQWFAINRICTGSWRVPSVSEAVGGVPSYGGWTWTTGYSSGENRNSATMYSGSSTQSKDPDYAAANVRCIKGTDSVCPTGWASSGGSCTRAISVCPTGYTSNGSNCKKSTTVCPSGFPNDNGNGTCSGLYTAAVSCGANTFGNVDTSKDKCVIAPVACPTGFDEFGSDTECRQVFPGPELTCDIPSVGGVCADGSTPNSRGVCARDVDRYSYYTYECKDEVNEFENNWELINEKTDPGCVDDTFGNCINFELETGSCKRQTLGCSSQYGTCQDKGDGNGYQCSLDTCDANKLPCSGQFCDLVGNDKTTYCELDACPTVDGVYEENGLCKVESCPDGSYEMNGKCIAE